MDLRIERTKRSIINAFIELRAKKPIEKITIKELSELALINKATFYSHYNDIYDLSEQLENEAIDSILKSLPHPEALITNSKEGIRELFFAIQSQSKLFDILFSGSRASILISKLEVKHKEIIYNMFPEYENNLEWDILLSVLIQGNFHAFTSHSVNSDTNELIDIIGKISEALLANYTVKK